MCWNSVKSAIAWKNPFLRFCISSIICIIKGNIVYENDGNGVSSPYFWGVKFLILGEQQYFSGYRLSKHKATWYAKNLGRHSPLPPPRDYAYVMVVQKIFVAGKTITILVKQEQKLLLSVARFSYTRNNFVRNLFFFASICNSWNLDLSNLR